MGNKLLQMIRRPTSGDVHVVTDKNLPSTGPTTDEHNFHTNCQNW